jgi:hypothetical protein
MEKDEEVCYKFGTVHKGGCYKNNAHKQKTEDKEEMTYLSRLPPGVSLSSSNRNNGGALKYIHFLDCDTGGERRKNRNGATCIPLRTHTHTRARVYDDVISCTDI